MERSTWCEETLGWTGSALQKIIGVCILSRTVTKVAHSQESSSDKLL